MDKIIINQSLIGKFFYKGIKREYCPTRVYKESITGEYKATTESMLKGSYFETLCLGSGVRNTKTEDLPRKKLTAKQILAGQTIGDKTIDQIRIEQQAMNFARHLVKYEINVQKEVNTQVEIFKQWSKNDNVILRGELDIFPTTVELPVRGERYAVIDLKLTAKFSTWGEYCWATPSAMDHTQGFMYHELVRDIDLDLNNQMNPNNKIQFLYEGRMKKQIQENEMLFFYFVFNYNDKELSHKFVEVPWNNMNRLELHESIRKTVEELNKNERYGWNSLRPTENNCKGCPVLNCEAKITFASKQTPETNTFETV